VIVLSTLTDANLRFARECANAVAVVSIVQLRDARTSDLLIKAPVPSINAPATAIFGANATGSEYDTPNAARAATMTAERTLA